MGKRSHQVGGSLALLSLFGILACPQKTAAWLAEGAPRGEPVFLLGEVLRQEKPVRFYVLNVYPCTLSGGSAEPSVWVVSETTGITRREYPTRIKYGEVPSGFVQQAPAKVLSAGCYVAATGGTGAVTFVVDTLGHVSTLGEGGDYSKDFGKAQPSTP